MSVRQHLKQIFSLTAILFCLSCSQQNREEEKFFSKLDDSTKLAFQIAMNSLDAFLDQNFEGQTSEDKVINMCQEIELLSISELDWKIDIETAQKINQLISLEDSSLYRFGNIESKFNENQYIRGLVECCSESNLVADYLDAQSAANNISISVIAKGIKTSLLQSKDYSAPLMIIVSFEFYMPYLIYRVQTQPNST